MRGRMERGRTGEDGEEEEAEEVNLFIIISVEGRCTDI